MAKVTSTWKKSNLGLMLEFVGILVLFGGYELGINPYVTMIFGLTLMLIGMTRFIKLVCSECQNNVDDKDVKLCPACNASFH